MSARHFRSLVLGLALAATPVLAASAADYAHNPRECFLTTQWQGWSAPANGDVLYLRIFNNEIWKVELTPGAHVRRYPDYFLINEVRGSPWICSPLDLDLRLSDHQGFTQPLIVRSLRKLTPEEVAAIPRKDMPY